MSGDRYVGSIPPMSAERFAELRAKYRYGDSEELLNEIERLHAVAGERDRFKLLLEQAVKSGGLDRPYVQTYTSEPCHELRAYLREGLKQDQGEGEG